MSVRLPLKTVLDYNDTGNVGATSVVSQTFTIPQDTDNLVLKIPVASINGTAPTADVYLQTSDDGGTTWYDVAALRIPATTAASVLSVTNANALWQSAAVFNSGGRSSSVVTGNSSVRGLAPNTYSGLPIMGLVNRVQIAYGGTVTTNNGLQVQVKVNSQSTNA
jgi:hypothetical protein